MKTIYSRLVVAFAITSVCLAASQAASSETAAMPDAKTIEAAIQDLASGDSKEQQAATKLLFSLEKDALEPLRKAGARQVSNKQPSLRRIDVVYSLIDGLKSQHNNPNSIVGIDKNRLGLDLHDSATQEDIQRMGKEYGFHEVKNLSRSPRPRVKVELHQGVSFEDTIRKVLLNESGVNTVTLEYWELPKCRPPQRPEPMRDPPALPAPNQTPIGTPPPMITAPNASPFYIGPLDAERFLASDEKADGSQTKTYRAELCKDGDRAKPTVIRNEETLRKVFRNDSVIERLAREIDFRRQQLVVFAWVGDASQQVHLKYNRATPVFYDMTRPVKNVEQPNVHLFVLGKLSEWSVDPSLK